MVGADTLAAQSHDHARPALAVDHRYLAPPPLEIPRLINVPARLRRKRVIAAVAALLVVAGGLSTFFIIRAQPAAGSVSMAQLTDQYKAAAATLDAGIATFKAAMHDAVQSGDVSQLDTFVFEFSGNLLSFDRAVQRLHFPARLQKDADAAIAADETLRNDLEGTSVATSDPVQVLDSDYTKAGRAHDTLNGDLGLPPSAFGTSSAFTA